MTRKELRYAECDWCGRDIWEGDLCVHLDRALSQPAWCATSESWRFTQLRSDRLSVLCRDCGAGVDPRAVRRRVDSDPNPDPDADPEELAWVEYPPEGREYAAYVRGLLREAANSRLGRARGVRCAVIDYAGHYEGTPLHFGEYVCGTQEGWIDPAYEAVGSCSRDMHSPERLDFGQWPTLRRHRDLSFVSTHCPNTVVGGGPAVAFSRLMRPLRHLPPADDHLYGWLKVLFAACPGQPVAYYSRYLPGPRIHDLAADHDVRLLSVPLSAIPEDLRERNRRFHLLQVTPRQRRALREGAFADHLPHA